MVLRASAQYRSDRKGVLSYIRSLHEKKFLDIDVKEPDNGFVRMQINKGYHYLEYIDAETSKYVCVMNVDPQLSYIP